VCQPGLRKPELLRRHRPVLSLRNSLRARNRRLNSSRTICPGRKKAAAPRRRLLALRTLRRVLYLELRSRRSHGFRCEASATHRRTRIRVSWKLPAFFLSVVNNNPSAHNKRSADPRIAQPARLPAKIYRPEKKKRGRRLTSARVFWFTRRRGYVRIATSITPFRRSPKTFQVPVICSNLSMCISSGVNLICKFCMSRSKCRAALSRQGKASQQSRARRVSPQETRAEPRAFLGPRRGSEMTLRAPSSFLL